ncbi:uncharacterized protein LOC128891616 [Hylaeus anthracinus]|uniref:uncharacterized protein LOC128875065 n=1 Tax=Hylaeus volcanicus TaxID=313075 RepID=UPI0023B82EC9|nr:uncharacterized protein LOC128875065 [Hylaeus volcanicus]XP_054007221.1 uncharacterized protein LOC128891616 [Hylaeus anthracinus]
MAHPGVVFLLGITIATALYYMFTSGETENQEPHNNGHRSTNTNTCYEPTNRWSPYDRNNRSRRRRTEDSTCSICLDTLIQAKKFPLQPCGHVFHKECIDQWMQAASRVSCILYEYNNVTVDLHRCKQCNKQNILFHFY